MSRSTLRYFAQYNEWATNKCIAYLHECVPAGSRSKNLGLYFESIQGTINHMYLAEALWYHRITGQSTAGLDRFWHNKQDVITYATFEHGCVLLMKQCKLWRFFLDEYVSSGNLETPSNAVSSASSMQRESFLNERVTYVDTTGKGQSLQLPLAVLHVMNHATHHRGQIHAACTQLGLPGIELDMTVMHQEMHENVTKKGTVYRNWTQEIDLLHNEQPSIRSDK